ncbi:hypothetical protein BDW22DRAFT_1357312, partial [Trametopsis cervina]
MPKRRQPDGRMKLGEISSERWCRRMLAGGIAVVFCRGIARTLIMQAIKRKAKMMLKLNMKRIANILEQKRKTKKQRAQGEG